MAVNSPILVTGIQRSGSTIIAKIIAMCGAFTGKTTEMLENTKIKALVDLYYEDLGLSTSVHTHFPNTQRLPIIANWKKSIEHIGDINQTKPWVFKSSTNCQIWPMWNKTYPNAKWVIVRRRTGDIVHSCMQTAYMRTFKDPSNLKLIGVKTEQDGWLWWVHQHEKLFVEMIEAGLNCKIVWPERMASGDYTQIIEMVEWLGLKWDDSIPEKISPLFRNSKQKGVK